MIANNIQPQAGASLNKSHPLSKGLIAYWPMNEGGGQKIFDCYGRGQHHGSLNSGASFIKNNRGGRNAYIITGSVVFDGSNDYIEIPSSTSFDSTKGTWCGWFNGSYSVSNGSPLIVRADAAGSTNGIQVLFEFGVSYRIKNAGNVLNISGGTNNDDKWHHWAITFNGTNTAYLYVDGLLVNSGTPSGSWNFNSQVIRMGTSTDTFWDKLNGAVANVSIYDRELSHSEVKWLFVNPYGLFKSNVKTNIAPRGTTGGGGIL